MFYRKRCLERYMVPTTVLASANQIFLCSAKYPHLGWPAARELKRPNSCLIEDLCQ